MALFHLHAKVISRSSGYSSVAAAAYRSASIFKDERTGEVHCYSKKGGVIHSSILLPPGAPEEYGDRLTLWNAVEASERRKDAQVCREIEFALPRELSDADNIELARAFAQEAFVDRGMIADVNVHKTFTDDGKARPHAHVMLTMRKADSQFGFGPKVREWNSTPLVHEWRELLAVRTNEMLAARGFEERIDHRSFKERGIDLTPQIKIGRHDKAHARVDTSLAIRDTNGQTIITDPSIALYALTEHQATFTRADMARFLNRHTKDAEQFARVLAKVEASPELVAIGKDAKGVERFSSRDMVASERRLRGHAKELAEGRGFGLHRAHLRAAFDVKKLGDEQAAALRYVTSDKGMVLLVGYAGTGKSKLLGAAREGWELAGHRVRGAALSGIAAENLEAGSGIEARTIASLEHAWKAGRDKLERGDVLVIDEAGMVGTRQLERVLEHANSAGAKVVLVGDAEQLQAIEAGAAFRALVAIHGAAQLTQVRRQRSKWMQDATREMATGRTMDALDRYIAAGMVHRSCSREAAAEHLITRWDLVRRERPERSQLILAYTRADVRRLNDLARSCMRASGDLGDDHMVKTERGERPMAVGDRVMFLRNDRGLGVKNGTLGELRGIEGGVLTVALDAGGKRGAGEEVRIDTRDYAALDHGYAATIHKSQGATVAQTHVLATPQMDRHATYVGLTRQTGRTGLHFGADDFRDERELKDRLSRDRPKDNALDRIAEAELRHDLNRVDDLDRIERDLAYDSEGPAEAEASPLYASMERDQEAREREQREVDKGREREPGRFQQLIQSVVDRVRGRGEDKGIER